MLVKGKLTRGEPAGLATDRPGKWRGSLTGAVSGRSEMPGPRAACGRARFSWRASSWKIPERCPCSAAQEIPALPSPDLNGALADGNRPPVLFRLKLRPRGADSVKGNVPRLTAR